MKTYPIPPSLDAKYTGSGYAIAAIKNGSVVGFAYFHDFIEEFDGENGADEVVRYADDARTGAQMAVHEALGGAVVGVMSCREFVEL